MPTRRVFLGELIGGAAALSVSSQASSRVLGANDRIRFGLIGAGGRGKEIFKAALKCPNVEAAGVADVYTRRLEEAKAIAPGAKTYKDYRQLLDDKEVDAVLIATPQHQHALSFVAAMQAGKDVYQEKTMAFNPAHARRMRRAFEGSGRVVQVGMQMNSSDGMTKVRELATADRMGTLSAILAHHYRNSPYGGWTNKIPPDCDTQHIDWAAFEAEAKPHAFDPQRYMNWRFFWDYSGGNMFENMVHEVGFWYNALDLKVPLSVTTTATNYHSPKMQMPDHMNVCMQQPEKILFTWSSMFSNNYFGEGEDYLFGNKGTLVHTPADEVRYIPQAKRGGTDAAAGSAAAKVEYQDYTLRHMQNFFDCVRSRKEPNCPFEIGFRAAIACQMAVASHRRQTPVRWDPDTEEIV